MREVGRRSLGLRGCRRAATTTRRAPHTTHSRKAEYAAPGTGAVAGAAIDAFRGTLPSNICETTSTSASIRFVKLSARMREPSMVPFHWDPRLLQPPKKQPWRPLHISEYANRIIIHTYILTYFTSTLLHFYGTINICTIILWSALVLMPLLYIYFMLLKQN